MLLKPQDYNPKLERSQTFQKTQITQMTQNQQAFLRHS